MKQTIKSSVLAFGILSSFAFGGNTSVPVSAPVVPIVNDFSPTFYIGGGLSYFWLEDDISSEKFSSYLWMISGGVNLNEYFGVETRYYRSFGDMEYEHGDTQNPNYDDFPATFYDLGVYVKGRYAIGDFEPYVLLGYGEIQFDAMPYTSGRAKRTENGFQWGVGASYGFTENISFFCDYVEFYRGDGFDGRATQFTVTSDAVTFGFTYKF